MSPYYRHFSKAEVAGLQPALAARLDAARELAGVAFIITAGLAEPGGPHVPGSAHLAGWAVDLRVSSSHQRFAILKALLDVGFTRVGVYDHHLHVDADPTKPQDVCWTGKSK